MKNTRFLVLILLLTAFAAAQTAGQLSSPSPTPQDDSKWFALLLAAQGSGGFDSTQPLQPSSYAGVKLGVPVGSLNPGSQMHTFTLDLGYDRLRSTNAVSTEASIMLPIFRYPKPQSDESRNYIRIYAEPGVGYRPGAGLFHGYASAKVMIALLSDKRMDLGKVSPYIELQRRIPFTSPGKGDNRIALGIMVVLCHECGLD